MILYHGSSKIIGKAIFGYDKKYNDFGIGVYCTEPLDMAKEWVLIEIGTDRLLSMK